MHPHVLTAVLFEALVGTALGVFLGIIGAWVGPWLGRIVITHIPSRPFSASDTDRMGSKEISHRRHLWGRWCSSLSELAVNGLARKPRL